MLAPVTYKRDLERLFGRIVNHRPLNWFKLKALRNSTKPIWIEHYPNEPFNPTSEVKDSLIQDFQTQFEYDIGRAVNRQRIFFYQVSLPHFRNAAFLTTSLNRYKMYLHLKKLHPETFLVPCYDMDVFWHAHQVQPVVYKEETQRILGHLLPHDDSVNDRNPGSKLCNSEETTRHLWKELYGQPFQRYSLNFFVFGKS